MPLVIRDEIATVEHSLLNLLLRLKKLIILKTKVKLNYLKHCSSIKLIIHTTTVNYLLVYTQYNSA